MRETLDFAARCQGVGHKLGQSSHSKQNHVSWFGRSDSMEIQVVGICIYTTHQHQIPVEPVAGMYAAAFLLQFGRACSTFSGPLFFILALRAPASTTCCLSECKLHLSDTSCMGSHSVQRPAGFMAHAHSPGLVIAFSPMSWTDCSIAWQCMAAAACTFAAGKPTAYTLPLHHLALTHAQTEPGNACRLHGTAAAA